MNSSRNTIGEAQIVVLGSKPNAALPAVAVPFVLTANNACELGVLYRQKYGSKIIAFVPIEELRNREHIQDSFKKSHPDEVVLLSATGTDREFVRTLGLTDVVITIINFRARNQLMWRALGIRIILVMMERLWFRGLKYLLLDAVPDFFGKRDMLWLSGSTGMDATFYALQHFPEAREVISSGIGLQEGTHFSGSGQFTSKTAKADRTTMKYWPYSRRKHLSTTDDALHSIGKVPKWQSGTTFFA